MTTTADRTIATSRLIDAPQDRVWAVWTDPVHLARWWGPDGFTSTIQAFKPWVGGRFDLSLEGTGR